MSRVQQLDADWRLANPIAAIRSGSDKDERGRILIVGGSRFVPGALRLTFEAALRVGAGKAQIATVASVAMALGVTLPEAAIVALPEDDEGEIAAGAAEMLEEFAGKCDCLVFGNAAAAQPQTADIISRLLGKLPDDGFAILDAGGIAALKEHRDLIRASGKRVILTPHHGELADVMGRSKQSIAEDPPEAAARAADDLGATVILKDRTTFIAEPGGAVFEFVNEAHGLGTAGSGDVLAGIIGGLVNRAGDTLAASAWAVWLHSQAGEAAARRIGPIGYLARDLLQDLPSLLGTIPTA
jgi:ADP-dependent NAD(P)H-hydrate dehydratase